MSESNEDESPAIYARQGQRWADMLSKQMEMTLDEHSAMARWLIASLLAINGAGALTVVNASDRLSRSSVDALPFVLGILAALVSAVLIQVANKAAGRVIGVALGHMWVVAETGDYAPEARAAVEGIEPEAKRIGKWAPRAGWISAGLFALGALAVGTDRPPVDSAAVARCEAIQDDMLSARPLRADGPALFTALGCRARGEGGVYASPLPSAPTRR